RWAMRTLPPPPPPRPPWRPPPRATAEQRRRTRLRHWLLWGTLPLWLTAIVLSLMLIINVTTAQTAIAEYENGDYYSARDRFDGLTERNVIEEWKAPFNLGTTQYRAEHLWSALMALDDALVIVPVEHRCMVQINRALTLEG